MIEESEGDVPEARTVLEKCCALSRQLEDKSILASAIGSLGVLQCASSDYDAAESSLTEALSLQRKNNKTSEEGVVLLSLGTVHRNRGNLSKALCYFNEALNNAEELKLSLIVLFWQHFGASLMRVRCFS